MPGKRQSAKILTGITVDAAVIFLIVSLVALLFSASGGWGEARHEPFISLDFKYIPLYGLYSISRIFIALFISLGIALTYGYAAAHSRIMERVLVPLLDVLQSIPVLSFMPAVVVSFTSFFGGSRLALELSSIVLIVTGQVWNLIFAFYSSIKSVPEYLCEASDAFKLNAFMKFLKIELPFAVPSLAWNAMLSVAGGWFFLMACEMLVIGDRSYIMPGIGAYIYTASQQGKMVEVACGVLFILIVIVLTDAIVWRPVFAWVSKFKPDLTHGEEEKSESFILDAVQHSRLFSLARDAAGWLSQWIIEQSTRFKSMPRESGSIPWIFIISLAGMLFAVLYYSFELLRGVNISLVLQLPGAALSSLARVLGALFISLALALPLGIYAGMRKRLSRRIQPVIQILASIPATAFFPIIIMFSHRLHLPHEFNALVLLVLSSQWYILFNVLAGASTIPT